MCTQEKKQVLGPQPQYLYPPYHPLPTSPSTLMYPQDMFCHSVEGQYFPEYYADLPLSYSYFYDPMAWQTTAPDLDIMLPTQLQPLWDVSSSASQTPTPPVTPLFSHSTADGLPAVALSPVGLPTVFHQSWTEIAVPDSCCNNIERGGGAAIPQVDNCPIVHELVPQDIYQPPRQKRKFKAFRTIDFSVRGEKGLLLSNALDGKWDGFDGRDDTPLSWEDGAQIMLRLRVVGCPPYESRISATDYSVRRKPITREKLANGVARSVKKFLEREKEGCHSGCHLRGVKLSDVYLTRLVRVSTGSWQPEIFVARASAPATPASVSI